MISLALKDYYPSVFPQITHRPPLLDYYIAKKVIQLIRQDTQSVAPPINYHFRLKRPNTPPSDFFVKKATFANGRFSGVTECELRYHYSIPKCKNGTFKLNIHGNHGGGSVPEGNEKVFVIDPNICLFADMIRVMVTNSADYHKQNPDIDKIAGEIFNLLKDPTPRSQKASS
jgi:hypothetical protein